jgi:hypothetical protein
MTVLPAGMPVPSFRLARGDGGSFTEQDLRGRTTVRQAPSPGDLPGLELLQDGLREALSHAA